MPRHFNGFVSRFSAGSRNEISPDDRRSTTSLLQGSGVSLPGAQQFLSGQIVANPDDRRTLAGIVGELLDLKEGQPVSHVALLLPAVQKVRDVPRRSQTLQDLGISMAGAQQMLSGQTVTSAEDRRALGQIVVAAVRG
jgi:hypothetical protein